MASESSSVNPAKTTGTIAGTKKKSIKINELKERFYKHVGLQLSATLTADTPLSMRDKVAAAKRMLSEQTVPDDWEDEISDADDENLIENETQANTS
ncbi:hypothetical protein I302_101390 [Kwoniella bestiolae CBS 10118]|uniref:Uncharacterized protein n=1 Tax=Kwoniella bestiolae CBS 10118 TaxID=1296100 RepID=A0A1B9GC54_9TREE|nr:hypothetical protein I302_00073 [Kwoniella bestiolae CBS 10118]OCF28585.1 hypothetical protein I302_00073 [Kwoniella bestiolae CBS 10118]